jgi:hypothetical protein
VEDWTPEPLVAKVTAFEEAQIEKGPVIVGYGCGLRSLRRLSLFLSVTC